LHTPKIPKESLAGVSNILKPAKLGLGIGDRQTFEVVKPHVVGQQGLLSLPVKYGNGQEGNFPLNKTHTTMFVEKLGDDSDDWVGATFEAVVVPQNNPQSKTQVLAWSVVRDSITFMRRKK
jgi:hypothetical protein